jgi:AbiV family abortive infection protein
MRTKSRKESRDVRISPYEIDQLLPLHKAASENAQMLLEEACILQEYGRHARASFLALTAFEEMGKAHIVADYANNCVSRVEFERAFSDHKTKTAYMSRNVEVEILDAPKAFCRLIDETIVYDRQAASPEINLREQSLYVSCGKGYEPTAPSSITEETCDSIISRVKQAFFELQFAEALNCRAGSAAIFK